METQKQNQELTTVHKTSSEESPLVVATKTFSASADEVFEAWRQEDMIKQWWGPHGFSCPFAHVDFKVGGKYLFSMKNEKDGKEVYSTGKYLEIEPSRKIVFTENFANSKGEVVSPNEAGMEGSFEDWDEGFVTVEIEAAGNDKCQMTLSHEGIPARMHDDCVEGWSQSLDKMKSLVERH
jgi:uncharacterized protein YndB with AHSA1/START domain